MEFPSSFEQIFSRIDPTFGRTIDCDSGWWEMIVHCDRELSQIDPSYSILQIKEKFGGLRYYYRPSNSDLRTKMDIVVAKYERICSMICEKTGLHGELMKRSGVYKTLHRSFIDEGWNPISATSEINVESAT